MSSLLGALVDGVDEDMDVMAGLTVHRKPYETACGGNGLGFTFGNQRPKRRWKGPAEAGTVSMAVWLGRALVGRLTKVRAIEDF